LLDLATLHFSGGKQTYDDDGAWARQGQIDEALIQRWLAEPYFQSPPPKSTGRELFGQADLERRLAEIGERNPADALATLSGFSAAVVAQELDHGPKPIELLLAGGGCRNSLLVEQLHRRCRGLIVRQLAEFGIGEAEREALAFALLAWWHVLGHQGNLPSVTGASGGAVLGLCAHPQAGRCKRTLRGAPRRRWGFWP
jgi:anhydro-N-acetylmuramic acid kinase